MSALPLTILSSNPTRADTPPDTRINFRKLLAKNPNHFGNFPSAGLEPIEKIAGNITYEALTCIGYDQALGTLQGTFSVKLPTGYLGALCTPGSEEYVRFYINYNDGSGWQDLGVAGFNSHDIPNAEDCRKVPEKPLSYSVTLGFQPLFEKQRFCFTPVTPLVRGIASWGIQPPENSPNWIPVWGNVLDQHIQIRPRLLLLKDVTNLIPKNAIDKLPSHVINDTETSVPLPDPSPVDIKTLAVKYGKEVEVSRFGLPILHQALTSSADQGQILHYRTNWSNLNLDFNAGLAQLATLSGNTSYESLDCLGLEYSLSRLVATFHVKRSSGFSGGLCSAGSTEYITFWSDWDDTCAWTLLGTVTVNVHDIPNIPKDGLAYTAVMPLDLASVRRSCAAPKVARVRAVLSWGIASSTSNPDQPPYWGNILDAHVQIAPGAPVTGPQISVIGGIGVAKIDVNSDGLAQPGATFVLGNTAADDHNRACPFGGRVVIQGPYLPGGLYYRVWVRSADTSQHYLTTPITVYDTTLPGSRQVTQTDGWFPYSDVWHNIDQVLAYFDTSDDDLWYIQLEVGTPTAGPTMPPSQWYAVQLDNTLPTCGITLTSASNCGDVTVGDQLEGLFFAQDLWFGGFKLGVSPSGNPVIDETTGASSGYNPSSAVKWTAWSLNTGGGSPPLPNMTPCGYAVVVNTWDRSIRNSSPGHAVVSASQGFCLRAKVANGNHGWEVVEE